MSYPPVQVSIILGRDDVESGDIGLAADFLGSLVHEPSVVQRMRGSMDLIFEGYDREPRPLHQVPAVRVYVASLSETFPYWIWFLRKDTEALALVLRCLAEVQGVHDADALFDNRLASQVLLLDEALIELYQRLHLPLREHEHLMAGEFAEYCDRMLLFGV